MTMKNFMKWLDNFWYHYKWRVIIIAFFAFVFVICGAQMITRENYDAYILYSGPALFDGEDESSVRSALGFVSGDYNGDGEKKICLTSIVVLSDDEIAEAKEQAVKEGTTLAYDYNQRQTSIKQYTTELMTGRSYLCFLSEYMYDMCKDKDRFVPIGEVTGDTPEGAYDECAVRLFDTEYGRYFSGAFQKMSEDTLICLRRISVSDASNKKAAAEYENYAEIFKNIINFEVKQ